MAVLSGNRCAGEKQLFGGGGGGGGRFPKDFLAFWFQQTINENVKARFRSNERLVAPPRKHSLLYGPKFPLGTGH